MCRSNLNLIKDGREELFVLAEQSPILDQLYHEGIDLNRQIDPCMVFYCL